jgi:hypothetical protein
VLASRLPGVVFSAPKASWRTHLLHHMGRITAVQILLCPCVLGLKFGWAPLLQRHRHRVRMDLALVDLVPITLADLGTTDTLSASDLGVGGGGDLREAASLLGAGVSGAVVRAQQRLEQVTGTAAPPPPPAPSPADSLLTENERLIANAIRLKGYGEEAPVPQRANDRSQLWLIIEGGVLITSIAVYLMGGPSALLSAPLRVARGVSSLASSTFVATGLLLGYVSLALTSTAIAIFTVLAALLSGLRGVSLFGLLGLPTWRFVSAIALGVFIDRRLSRRGRPMPSSSRGRVGMRAMRESPDTGSSIPVYSRSTAEAAETPGVVMPMASESERG